VRSRVSDACIKHTASHLAEGVGEHHQAARLLHAHLHLHHPDLGAQEAISPQAMRVGRFGRFMTPFRSRPAPGQGARLSSLATLSP
jgi:hypothetical protein